MTCTYVLYVATYHSVSFCCLEYICIVQFVHSSWIASFLCVGGVRMKYPSHCVLVMGMPQDEGSSSSDNTCSKSALGQLLSHWPSSDLAEGPRWVMIMLFVCTYIHTLLLCHMLNNFASLATVLDSSYCVFPAASTKYATVKWFRRPSSMFAFKGMYQFQSSHHNGSFLPSTGSH